MNHDKFIFSTFLRDLVGFIRIESTIKLMRGGIAKLSLDLKGLNSEINEEQENLFCSVNMVADKSKGRSVPSPPTQRVVMPWIGLGLWIDESI